MVCLIGANGAGKTTTMRALSGLLRPAAGRIAFDGADITGCAPHRIAALGMRHVPEGRQIFAGLTVAENLPIGAWLVAGAAEIARRQEEVLARFPRLKERLGQLAGSMSGGEQQMLALGRALMGAPRLLLLDEPSMGLAPLFVEEIFGIIADLRREGPHHPAGRAERLGGAGSGRLRAGSRNRPDRAGGSGGGGGERSGGGGGLPGRLSVIARIEIGRGRESDRSPTCSARGSA